MRLYALRGATQLEHDTEQQMLDKVEELMKALFESNSIDGKDVVSIHFTMTEDLHSLNPATAYRKRCKDTDIPLFCSQEPTIDGMMPRVVRVLLHLYRDEKGQPLKAQYHGNTKRLRPDL